VWEKVISQLLLRVEFAAAQQAVRPAQPAPTRKAGARVG
jgi:hypothetical protein